MSSNYFDDNQEIGPQALTLLRKVVVDLYREKGETATAEEELAIARELVALFKSGFRTEEELKAMASSMTFFDKTMSPSH